jgi:archaetidylinositol phosphate synthase
MIETHIRPFYQKYCVDPIARRLPTSVQPHTVTLCACLVGILTAPILIAGYPLFACFFLILSGYLDTLDGTLARQQSSSSPIGTVFDITADRIVEIAVILGLFGIGPLNRGWLCLGMLGSILVCITTFLVVGIFAENTSSKGFHYSPGLIERAEAFLFFIAMMLFPAYFTYLALLFILLVLATSLLRIREFWKYNS